jgi:hypothetical protein
MFNELVLHIIRGSRTNHVAVCIFFDSQHSLRSEIDKLTKRRLARGYTLISKELHNDAAE